MNLRLLPLLALTVILSGCGDVRMTVSFQPDGSARFVEDIFLENYTQESLGILQKPGDTDFWQRLKAICKKNNWNYKDKSANHIVIDGTYPKDQVKELSSVLSKQFDTIAEGYGATRISPAVSIPVSIDLKDAKSTSFETETSGNAKITLKTSDIEKAYRLPDQWGTRFYPPVSSGALLTLKVVPGSGRSVVSTNADKKDESSMTWVIPYGSEKTVEAVVRKSSLPAWAFPAAIGAVFVLAAAAIFAIKQFKNKTALKETAIASEPETPSPSA